LKLAALVATLAVVPANVAWAGIEEIAARVGIAETTRTFSVAAEDFDRDGRGDFLLVRHNPDLGPQNLPSPRLYRSMRRGFVEFASQSLGATDKHGCAWGRANADRLPDLFCSIGYTQFSVNELWLQNRNGTFTNRAQQLGLTRDTHGRYRYATFIHANRDRRADIYVARYTGSCFCGRYDGDNHPNELWINRGSSFRKAPEFGLNRPIGAKKDTSACAQAVDYDRDGDQDLLVCGQKSTFLYRNKRGRGFADVTRAEGLGGNAFDAGLVRLNKDRFRDFVRLTRSELTIRYGTRRGWRRVSFSRPAPGGEALAFGKFNRDRRTDIYVLNSRGDDKTDNPDYILLNRGRRNRFRARVLPAVRGSGDDVAGFDYNNNGRTDFVVTNGDRKKPGPVQLFTWRRGRRR
jgi:hypothetical protein